MCKVRITKEEVYTEHKLGSSWQAGAAPGLQIQWGVRSIPGGFDSHLLPPTEAREVSLAFLFGVPGIGNSLTVKLSCGA